MSSEAAGRPGPLEGQIALVSGAGTGIGAAIAMALARAGCDVAVHFATNDAGARQTIDKVRSLGRRASMFRADLSDREQLIELASRTLQWSNGRLDVLVNNAASFERTSPDMLDAESWDRSIALNLTAPYLLTMKLVKPLREHSGCMVAVACTSALRPWKHHVPYSVTKAGLVHLVRSLAVALAPKVRVNAVAPGVIATDRTSADGAPLHRIPLARVGTPDDIANTVVFLTTNQYATGQVLAIDGGFSLA